MTTPQEHQILEALAAVADPETGRSLRASQQLRVAKAADQSVELEVALTSWSAAIRDDLAETIRRTLQDRIPKLSEIHIVWKDLQRKPLNSNPIGLECKSVIAVAAGKGGVGKSTVAACLAMALQRCGARVGLLDADVYGPSIPQITGATGHPAEVDGKIQPIVQEGIPVMSIGFMVPPDQAVIWRGPMLHSAVTKFLRDTAWGPLDYLIIDMPPGTGDVALTLSQTMPIDGAVIVCTPQRVALLDAIKAVGMFQRVKIPVLGVVENMSTFVCPGCQKQYDIFGHGGARQYAQDAGLSFLGEIPILIPLRERGDAGTSRSNLDDPQVAPYLRGLAKSVTAKLAAEIASNPPRPSLPVI